LRAAAEDPERRVIRFGVSGEIRLASPIRVSENKTIDGRGANITLANRGLVLHKANVIVRNLKFGTIGDLSKREDPHDAILIAGARNVWIDHCTFGPAGDKQMGIPSGTDITVSWSRFTQQKQVLQVGTFSTREKSKDTRVTIHHNFFDNNGYRQPRVSYAKVHTYNNYVGHWKTHGMSAVRGSELVVDRNIFEAGTKNNAVIFSGGVQKDKDRSPGLVRASDNLLLNDARIRQNRPDDVFDARQYYRVRMDAANSELKRRLTSDAGWMETTPSSVNPPLSGRNVEEPTPPSPDRTSELTDPAEARARPGVPLLAVIAAGGAILAVGFSAGYVLRAHRAPTSSSPDSGDDLNGSPTE
jgi:pectate lyase